ncbi:MAG: ATP-binding domain-containing protein, partial [Lachnospiraceae bacterium]|nr:ATP-binding domain-containing protein [Lachnospiraceae bacterium]
MVGDEHQLPSVGPGSVLKDLLQSGRFKSLTLKKIFRQAEESDIVMNAHALLKGREMKLDNKSKDFFFLERQDIREITEGIVYLVKKKLPPYVGAPPGEMQVLTPMRKGPLGVENLNRVLQAALNPPDPGKKEIDRGEYVIRTGDRVMQTRNDYRMEWEADEPGGFLKVNGSGVFNGDMGIVVSIDSVTRSLVVRFEDGRRATYTVKELPDLELCYAITIHKSQGSEYPAVIMPLLGGPDRLMSRNLLYTGITRAKKCVVIIGSGNTVKRMEENKHEQERYTGLCREIKRLAV